MVKIIIAVLILCSLALVVVVTTDVVAIETSIRGSNLRDTDGSSSSSSSSSSSFNNNSYRRELSYQLNRPAPDEEDNGIPIHFLRKKSTTRLSIIIMEEESNEEEMTGMRGSAINFGGSSNYLNEKNETMINSGSSGVSLITDVSTEEHNFKQLHIQLSQMSSGGPPPMHWILEERDNS
jgi:hypothetical protein